MELYNDKKIVFEELNPGEYRATFFNNDNHWGGDIIFNKDGIISNDLSEKDIFIEKTIEWLNNNVWIEDRKLKEYKEYIENI